MQHGIDQHAHPATYAGSARQGPDPSDVQFHPMTLLMYQDILILHASSRYQYKRSFERNKDRHRLIQGVQLLSEHNLDPLQNQSPLSSYHSLRIWIKTPE